MENVTPVSPAEIINNNKGFVELVKFVNKQLTETTVTEMMEYNAVKVKFPEDTQEWLIKQIVRTYEEAGWKIRTHGYDPLLLSFLV